jgi:predicted secreted protein
MTAATPAVSVTPSQPAITNVQALPVTVGVSGSAGVPTGSVILSSGAWSSSASTLVGGVANITIPAGVLSLGSATLTAAYTPNTADSGVYLSATGTGAVTVTIVVVSLPSKLQGYKAQITYTPNGGAPVIIAGLKDLEGGFKVDELDATDHGQNGWKSRMMGLNDFDGSAKLDYIAGDASQEYLLQAVLNHTVLNVTLFPILAAGSGVDSYVGSAIITDFKWDGKNNDLQGVQVTLKGAGPFSVVAQ